MNFVPFTVVPGSGSIATVHRYFSLIVPTEFELAFPGCLSSSSFQAGWLPALWYAFVIFIVPTELDRHSLAASPPPPFRLLACLHCGMRLCWVWSSMSCYVLSSLVCECVVVSVAVYVLQRWRQRQKMASHQLLYQQKTPQRPCQWNFLEASHFSFDFFSKVFFVFLILMLCVVVVSWSDNCYAGFLDLITENWFPEWCGVADIPSCSQRIGFFSVHGETNSIYRHFKSCSITKSRYIKAKLHSKTSDYNLFLIGFKIGFL